MTAPLSKPAAVGGVVRGSLLDAWARRAVLAKLATLSEGELRIVDPWGEAALGEPRGALHGETLRARVEVLDPRFYRRVLGGGSIGVARSFVDGDWRADDLVALLRIFARERSANVAVESGAARVRGAIDRVFHALRANSPRGSRRNIADHYDLGNDFFALFLDASMTYSAALFDAPGLSLAEATRRKLDLVCRKLELRPEDRLLEIGTGWGSLSIHAAARYGCRVTTTTISRAQAAEAKRRIAAAGVADRVEILEVDYRELPSLGRRFSKLASIEMIEAVGERFLDRYLATLSEVLAPDGLALVQAILMGDRFFDEYRHSADFIQRMIFPGSFLPGLGDLVARLGRTGDLALVHLEDLTPDYVETLARWRAALAARASEARAMGVDERQLRLFDFYFAYCEAGFSERVVRDAQLLLAKPRNRSAPVRSRTERAT